MPAIHRARALVASTVLCAAAACSDPTALPTEIDLEVFGNDVYVAYSGIATASSISWNEMSDEIDVALTQPDTLLGKTLEWNFDTGKYQVTDRTGGPANGIRFVLLAIGFPERMPVWPGYEEATLDVVPGGTPAAPTVTVTLGRFDVAELVKFTAVRGGTATRPTASLTGHAGTPELRSDFTLQIEPPAADQVLKADWRMTTLASDATTRTRFAISPTAYTVSQVFRNGLNLVEMAGTVGFASGGQLSVDIGNRGFATLAVGSDDVAVATGAAGRVLDVGEAGLMSTLPQMLAYKRRMTVDMYRLAERFLNLGT